MKTVYLVCSTTGPQSGKSTFTKRFLEADPDTVHLRFSAPIQAFLEACTGLDYETAKRSEIVPGITGRDIMLGVGEGLRKECGADIFAKLMVRRIQESPAKLFIIDDFRKRAELNSLVGTGYRVAVMNIVKPDGGPNDCEFDESWLKFAADPSYHNITWDSFGGFKNGQ